MSSRELTEPRPVFPGTPEQLARRRQEMRRVVEAVEVARRSGRRAVPPTAFDDLRATFIDRVHIEVDWGATDEMAHPMIVIRGARNEHPELFDSLTPRERDVARLLVAGRTNKEIAACLGIALGTVKDHVHNILSRTGCRSRLAFAAAIRR